MPVVQKRPYSFNDDQSFFCFDLHQTKTYLEKLRAEKPKLALDFNAWREHRKLTIETVDSLQKKIDTLCVGCNVARGAGTAVGVVGILAWTVGIILKLKGHKSAGDLFQASKYCAGASTVTVTSSTLLEMGLTRTSMNEIERVLKKDIELTKPLQEWIQCSHKVESLFRQLFQCNIASTTFANIMKVCGYCFQLLDAGIAQVDDLVRDLQCYNVKDLDDPTLEVAQKALKFFRKAQNNPRLLTPMREICKIFKEASFVFEFATWGTEIYCKAYQLMNSGPLSVGLTLGSLECSGFTGVALNMAALASHVVDFILVVKNIQEGKSKYSGALDEIKTALKSELDEVTTKMMVRVQRGKTNYDILALRN